MKGTIVLCMRDMLADVYDVKPDQWGDVVEAVGLDRRNGIASAYVDIEDRFALAIFAEVQKRYFKDLTEMANAFGHYWCVTYAPKNFPATCKRFSNAREFILAMDSVHIMVTKSIRNATPPRFEFEPIGDNKLRIHYQSKRGLIHIFAGLCRGLGAYFGEKLTVEVLSEEFVEIEFLGK